MTQPRSLSSLARPGRARWSRLALLLLAFVLVGCRSELHHNLPERDAAEMVQVLQQHGIDADKELDNADDNLWRVTVPRRSDAHARAILADYDLPREQDRRRQDIFAESGIIPTPLVEEEKALEGLEGELAYTLRQMPGVIKARVHVVPMQVDIAKRPTLPAKASAYVEYQPTTQGFRRPVDTVEVQKTIAGAVAGLEPANVAVTFKPTSIARPALPGQISAGSLVRVGPITLESGSLATLKVLTAVAVLLLAGLGLAVFWQSRLIGDLRLELQLARSGQLAGGAYGGELPAGAEGAGGELDGVGLNGLREAAT